jgi:hypothetical protein
MKISAAVAGTKEDTKNTYFKKFRLLEEQQQNKLLVKIVNVK